jgi:ABC-type uncharacterized transport system involved in gliding motility auxiliary subunit
MTAKSQANEGSKLLHTLGRLAGAVGLVLVITSPFTWFLVGHFGVVVLAKLLVGILGLGFFVATDFDTIGRLFGSRTFTLTAITAAFGVIAVGLVGAVNYVALENDVELDMTREGVYTLSERTLGVLGRLDEEVKIQAFYAEFEDERAWVESVLDRYAGKSDELKVEMVDPLAQPELAERYKISLGGPRIVVTSGREEARAKDATEQELTNAIVQVAERTGKKVYFLTGHGEGDLTEETAPEGYKLIGDAVESEGYKVEALNLLESPATDDAAVTIKATGDDAKVETPKETLEIPLDASLLVVAGARSRIFEPELAAIEDYLKRGGRLLALLDPDSDTGLEDVLEHWKIHARDDIVVDTNPMNRLMGLGAASPLVFPVEKRHPITERQMPPAVMPTVCSLEVAVGGEPGADTQPLVETGDSAWGETAPKDGAAERDDKDNLGPVSVGLVSTKEIPATDADRSSDETRIAAFCDSDWASNGYLSLQGNADLFLNTLAWLAEQEEKITIRPKTRTASQLTLSADQMGMLTFLSMDIVPVLLIAVGLGIVLNRRRR